MTGDDASAVVASLLAHSLDAVVLTDVDFNVIDYGGSAEQLYGRARADVLGRDWFGAVPTTITSAAADDVMELLRDQQAVRVEARFQHPTGEWVDALISATPLRDGQGHLTGWLGIGRDITALKAAERREVQTRERLNRVLDGSNDGYFEVDVQTQSLVTNHRVAEMLGYAADAFTTTSAWTALIHPEDLPHVEAEYTRLTNWETAQLDLEYRVRHPDAGWRWVRVRCKVEETGLDGRATSIAGTIRDITAERVVSERNTELLARLETVLDASRDGIWECHLPTGRCQFNRRWAEMLGYEPSDIEPSISGWERLMHPDDLPGAREQMQAHVDGLTDAFQFECRLRHRDGHWIWVWDRGRIVERDTGGVPLRAAGTHTDITAMKQAEALLIVREATLSAYFNSSAVGIAISDLTGRFVEVNQRFCEMLGYSRDELIGRPFVDVTHPEDRTLHAAPLGALSHDAAATVTLEKRYVRKDGSVLWAQTGLRNCRDRDGRLLSQIASIADITARKDAERQLLDVRNRLNFVLEGANDGFWDWHVPSGAVTFSARWASMLGYDVAELPSHVSTWERLVHPDDVASVTALLEAHLRGDTPLYESEHRVRHKDGQWVWILDRGKVVERDPQGRAIRAAGTHTDVRARRTAAELLQSREEELRSIVGAMAEGVVFQAADGRIVRCNEAAERILGLTWAQMEGRESSDPRWRAIHEDGSDYPGETHPATRALRTGRPVRDAIMGVHRPDGELRWILINAEPLRRAETEAPFAVVATFADITALRGATQQLAVSEARYRGLFQSLREEVSVFDVVRDEAGQAVDWVLRDSNDAARRRLPVPLGTSMRGAFGEAFGPIIAQTDEFLSGRSMPHEMYFGPLELWYESSAFGIGPDSIVSVALDITERKAADRRVRESEALFRTVVERASDAIHLTNLATGRVEVMNARYVELLGWPEEELRGQSSQDALDKVHPDDRPRVIAHWRQMLESGAERSEPLELRTRTKAGEYRWVSHSSSVVRDATGQPRAVVGVSHDITERKRIEGAVRAEMAHNTTLVRELRETLATKTLGDFLPTCMYCKKIRDDEGRWHRLEEYITSHTGALFSHGLCPTCSSKMLEQLHLDDDSK